MIEPTLNYVLCPGPAPSVRQGQSPRRSTAWPGGSGMPPATRSTRMWWSACTACRARGGTSIPWPGPVPPRAGGLPRRGGPRPQRLAGRPHGLPRGPVRCRHAGLACNTCTSSPRWTRWTGWAPAWAVSSAWPCAVSQVCRLPVPVRRLVLNDVGPAIQWEALVRIGQYLGQPVRFASLQQAADMPCGRMSTSFGPHTPQQWLELSRPHVACAARGGLGAAL
jgi:hypothetical protein